MNIPVHPTSQPWRKLTATVAGATILAGVIVAGTLPDPADAQTPASASAPAKRDLVLDLLGVVTAPSISGNPSVGATLSAQGPVWTLLNVTTSVTWLRNGAPIPGATGATYTLTAADAGTTIQIQAVGAVLGLLPVTAYSNAMVIGVPAPTNPTTPTPTPTNPTTPTPTPTNPTTPTPTNPTPTDPTTPTPTTPTPTDPTTPTPTTPTPTTPTPTTPTPTTPTPTTPTTPTDPVVDVLRVLTVPDLPDTGLVGGLLTVLEPVWNLPGVTTTYQWLRDGAAIDGADGQVYVPVLADAGHLLSVQISGQLLGLSLVSVHTDAVEVADITTDQDQVEALGDVTVTGSRRIGTTLTAVSPAWDEAGATATYQWMRDDAPIAHETSATYDVVPADWGHELSVRITGHAEGMLDSTIASDPIAVELGAAIRPTTKPSMSGDREVGQVLTAAPGVWTDATDTEDPGFTYQWTRDGETISGAVAQTYQLTSEDAGRMVGVTVTAIRPGYRTGVFSTARAAVAKQVSTTRVTLGRKKVRAGRSLPVRVKVTVPELTAPGGTIAVYDRKRLVGTVDVGSTGAAKVVLRKVRRGAHRIMAVYSGTAGVAPSTSPVVRIKVRRR